VHHKNGWTALAMPDRTGDGRGNSHSVFLFEEIIGFSASVARARELFGPVVKRIEAAHPIFDVVKPR
jgi:hypothetical protein